MSLGTGDSQGTIHVGLLGQLHYVALDRIVVSDMSNDDNDIIDNEHIEEGDEHNRQITGGPSESFMFLENPEADGQVFSVAPAEGQTPLSIMTDKNFEIMCNPNKFPLCSGAFNCKRDRKIIYRKYFNQRLLDVDGRFARDLDYLFVAQYIVEAKQILDDANNFIWRQKPGRQIGGDRITASQVKNPDMYSVAVLLYNNSSSRSGAKRRMVVQLFVQYNQAKFAR